jgi:hypothetical protein
MLVEVLKVAGVNVDVADFICENDVGQRLISTAFLPYYLGIWEARAESSDSESHEERGVQINDCLSESRAFVNSIVLRERFSNEANFLGQEDWPGEARWLSNGCLVLFSIILLGEALAIANARIYGFTILTKFETLELVDRLLLKVGWCANEVASIKQRSDNSEAYYLSLIDRHHLGRNHQSCSIQDPSIVLNWTKEQCSADQIKELDYCTKHFPELCNCRHISVDEFLGQDLLRVLSRRQVPLILVHRDAYNSISHCSIVSSRLRGLSSWVGYFWKLARWFFRSTSRIFINGVHSKNFPKPSPVIPFVAISHVWADGLGNVKRNSLPECQLLLIQNMVNSLYGTTSEPVAFWIDTICVPHDPRWRKLAIIEMNRVYREVDKVFVLDMALRKVSLHCEALLRIKYSNWARRLWTLPEGALANNLIFQFKDGTISGEELIKWYEIIHDEEGWSDELRDGEVDMEILITENKIKFEDRNVAQIPSSEIHRPSTVLASQWASYPTFSETV